MDAADIETIDAMRRYGGGFGTWPEYWERYADLAKRAAAGRS